MSVNSGFRGNRLINNGYFDSWFSKLDINYWTSYNLDNTGNTTIDHVKTNNHNLVILQVN